MAGFWLERPVVSRGKGTRYWGGIAELWKRGGAHEASDSERVETCKDKRDKRGTEVRIKE
jgi:hypothetical protein